VRGEERDLIFRELVAFGPVALVSLREELKHVGAGKAATLLKECLQWIEGPEASNLARAVVRQIGRRKPEKAVPALLAYLGVAEDELAITEVRDALTALALRAGKPDPILLAAVKDADHVRHGIAAEALCAASGGKAARALLRDPDALLRLRIALVLIER